MRPLPKGQQATWRRTLQAAHERPTYPEAKAALLRIQKELMLRNESAVRSLDEGVEETLTLHRLGLFSVLGISHKTTNCLESLQAQVGAYTDKVDRWRRSDQHQRWVASALLAIEPRLRRGTGYRHLPLLRAAPVKPSLIPTTMARRTHHHACGGTEAGQGVDAVFEPRGGHPLDQPLVPGPCRP